MGRTEFTKEFKKEQTKPQVTGRIKESLLKKDNICNAPNPRYFSDRLR